ncbi:MAG: transposase family protein [Desulfobacteraceae bacterium]|nr:transposase family protein [Desulfobacteraceae bacterium]
MSWQEEMVAELSKAKNGNKTHIMKRYEAMTGKTTTHLYRIAKKFGYETVRKNRADKGECCLTELQIKFIAGQIHTTGREKKGTIMPVKEALDIAEQNNIIPPGSVSVARMQDLLRERGLNKKALNTQRPHVPMRSLHPNHVHFMDVSVCIQYYLKNKQLRIENEKKFYKNKWENFGKIKQKIYRYVLTDHFSHTIFVKYYIAKGETQDNLFDFLTSAWGTKNNGKYPFRGVPFLLMMDRGAANISKAIIKFLKNLDVEFPEPGVHNPMRQGSVERAQNHVEMYFESKLKIQSVSDIQELNHYAMDWCAFMNAKFIHTRFGTPRTHCWLKIKEHQLRERPDLKVLQDIYSNPSETRLVDGDYSISFKGERFRLKHVEDIIPNYSKVNVFLKPFIWPQIVVEFREKEYTARPIKKADGGFDADAAVIGQNHKSMPESTTQQKIKQIENLAYGEDRHKDDTPFAGLHVFGGQSDRITTEFMPKKSIPMNITKDSLEERRISMFDLFKDLSLAGIMSASLNHAIRAKYGESISMVDRDRLVDAMEEGLLIVDKNGNLRFEGEDNDSLKAVAN